eukprot:scaffold718_cov342-Pavlova_lutheri.AAC.16
MPFRPSPPLFPPPGSLLFVIHFAEVRDVIVRIASHSFPSSFGSGWRGFHSGRPHSLPPLDRDGGASIRVVPIPRWEGGMTFPSRPVVWDRG